MDIGTVQNGKQAALALRYGENALPEAGPWSAAIELLLSHRSVRGYTDQALPAGTLETLVAAAQSAATSSNMQTWSVIVVRDASRKAALAKIAGNQKHIEQCPLFLVWLADLSRAKRIEEAEGVPLVTLPYLESFLVAAIDAALAVQNAVVAAESLGLSTVYIGALRNKPVEVAELLGLPQGAMAVFGLCVGYAAAESASEVKPRLPQQAVAFDETYGVRGDETALRRSYDAKLARFSQRNEMSDDTWTRRVQRRMGSIASMGGRDRLAEALKTLGFPLR